MHTLTVRQLPGATFEAAREALFEKPWRWWRHGRVSGWQRTDAGGARFVIWPMWLRSPARVGVELAAVEEGEERLGELSLRRASAAMTLFKDFHGPAATELIEVEDGCVVRSRWLENCEAGEWLVRTEWHALSLEDRHGGVFTDHHDIL